MGSEAIEAANAAVTVRLPGVLVDLFPGSKRSVEMSVSTVDEMIRELDARWPGMRDRLCDSTPAVRRHINIFIDGERARLDTRIEPGTDSVHPDRDQRGLILRGSLRSHLRMREVAATPRMRRLAAPPG